MRNYSDFKIARDKNVSSVPESEQSFGERDWHSLAALRFGAAGYRGLMPTDVRAALERLRFPIRTHKNILASIHTVIRRLEQGGEIRKAIHDLQDGSKQIYLPVGWAELWRVQQPRKSNGRRGP